MVISAKTHVGRVRSSNQDALLLDAGLYGVADGMGGHNGGEVASTMAVNLIKELLQEKIPDVTLLEKSIKDVNGALFAKQSEEIALEGMGTTLTLLWEGKELIILGHVGDSRAYLYRQGQLNQMTQDHSVVAEMMRQGILTKEKARIHPYRNVITRAVGTAPDIEADIFTHNKQQGDIWLVCSDGLTNMVEDNEITKILENLALEEAADALLELALENGGRDNISLLLAKVAEETL